MATDRSADKRADPGFAEFRFDDGALIQVSAYAGQVTVLQQQASAQGRGAAFLDAEQALELAAALESAADVAREQAAAAPAPAVPPLSAEPTNQAAAPALTAEQIAAIVNQALDARLEPKSAES